MRGGANVWLLKRRMPLIQKKGKIYQTLQLNHHMLGLYLKNENERNSSAGITRETLIRSHCFRQMNPELLEGKQKEELPGPHPSWFVHLHSPLM